MKRALAAALCLALLGCEAEQHLLVVNFATDVPSGSAFIAVEASLSQEGVPVAESLMVARLGESFVMPRQLAAFEGLPPASYQVDVELTDIRGRPVARRSTQIFLERSTTLTVAVSASCVGVACPGATDAIDATTCHGGACVDPRCSDDAPEFCDAACEGDAECAGAASCVGGVCLTRPGGGCDDDNPCTDDRLELGECVHGDNTAPCDDGVFCNGADTCEDGACAIHGALPCAAERCNESARSCQSGCVESSDCPEPVLGGWSDCAGFAGACGQDGEQQRTVTAFECVANQCEPAASVETQSCTRDTNGLACGDEVCGAWEACIFNSCRADGHQNRRCDTPTCSDGTCSSSARRSENQACSRPPPTGDPCRPPGLLCEGTCNGEVCENLCAHCTGGCTQVGCRGGDC